MPHSGHLPSSQGKRAVHLFLQPLMSEARQPTAHKPHVLSRPQEAQPGSLFPPVTLRFRNSELEDYDINITPKAPLDTGLSLTMSSHISRARLLQVLGGKGSSSLAYCCKVR